MTRFGSVWRCVLATWFTTLVVVGQPLSSDGISMREKLEKAVKTNPNSAPDLESLAIFWLKAGQTGLAAGYLDRALQILGNSPEAAYPHYLRAKVYVDHNEIAKAEAELAKAVSLQPEFAAAWSDLGFVRNTLLDSAGALAAYQRAVALDPADAVARYRLGAAYLDRRQPRLAIPQLEKALTESPDDQSTLYSLQLALREDGQTERAEEVKRRLVETLQRRDVVAQNALKAVVVNNEGVALEKKQNLFDAIQKYRQALDLSPEQNAIRVNLAIALLRTGQWSEGLSQLREAMRRDRSNDLLKRAWDDAASQAPAGTMVDGAPLNSHSDRQRTR